MVDGEILEICESTRKKRPSAHIRTCFFNFFQPKSINELTPPSGDKRVDLTEVILLRIHLNKRKRDMYTHIYGIHLHQIDDFFFLFSSFFFFPSGSFSSSSSLHIYTINLMQEKKS